MTARELMQDIAGTGGLAAVGVGVWWLSPAWSLIVVGLIVLALAIVWNGK